MAALLNTCLKPRKDELEPVPVLYFVDEFVNGEVARHRGEKRLDRCLVTVHVEKAPNDLRGADGVDASDVDFDEVGQAALVQVEHEVVDEVEAVATHRFPVCPASRHEV